MVDIVLRQFSRLLRKFTLCSVSGYCTFFFHQEEVSPEIRELLDGKSK
jgi:hypothetical protein